MLYLGLKIKYCLKMLLFEWNLNLFFKNNSCGFWKKKSYWMFKKD